MMRTSVIMRTSPMDSAGLWQDPGPPAIPSFIEYRAFYIGQLRWWRARFVSVGALTCTPNQFSDNVKDDALRGSSRDLYESILSSSTWRLSPGACSDSRRSRFAHEPAIRRCQAISSE